MDFFKKKKESDNESSSEIPLPEPPKPADLTDESSRVDFSQSPSSIQSSSSSHSDIPSPLPSSSSHEQPEEQPAQPSFQSHSHEKESPNFQELLQKHMVDVAPPKPMTLAPSEESSLKESATSSSHKKDSSMNPPQDHSSDSLGVPSSPEETTSSPSSQSSHVPAKDKTIAHDLDLSLDNLDLSIPDISFDDFGNEEKQTTKQEEQSEKSQEPSQQHQEAAATHAIEQAITTHAEQIHAQQGFMQPKKAFHAARTLEKKEAYLEASQAKEVGNHLEEVFTDLQSLERIQHHISSSSKKENQYLTKYQSLLKAMQNDLLQMDKIIFQKR